MRIDLDLTQLLCDRHGLIFFTLNDLNAEQIRDQQKYDQHANDQ